MSAVDQLQPCRPPLRAALYVCASTPVQTLSPVLQEEFLRHYATAHDLPVVRMYLDHRRGPIDTRAV